MVKSDSKVNNLSDSELVTVIRMKNQELYQEIVNRYEKRLFIYIYRMVGNKEEVEDILQNVFVKVYKNLKSFDETRKFSSWIYRISHNEAVNFLKKRNKKKFISWEDIFLGENSIEAKSEDKSPVEDWLSKERKIEVDKAIEKLPKRYREVLILRYFSEKSYEEIGKVLGKSVNTVGTLLSRAKKKLLQVIKEEK